MQTSMCATVRRATDGSKSAGTGENFYYTVLFYRQLLNICLKGENYIRFVQIS